MPIPSAPILQPPVHSASPSVAPSSAPKSAETQQLVADNEQVKREQAAVKLSADEVAELDRRLAQLKLMLHNGISAPALKKVMAEINDIHLKLDNDSKL